VGKKLVLFLVQREEKSTVFEDHKTKKNKNKKNQKKKKTQERTLKEKRRGLFITHLPRSAFASLLEGNMVSKRVLLGTDGRKGDSRPIHGETRGKRIKIIQK